MSQFVPAIACATGMLLSTFPTPAQVGSSPAIRARVASTTSTAARDATPQSDAYLVRPFDPIEAINGTGTSDELQTSEAQRVVYIPADLDEALRLLRTKLSRKVLNEIEKSGSEDVMTDYHFSLGLTLRNGWGLWDDSRLARFFAARGIQHADDMSGIILVSLWRDLHGKPVDLDEQTSRSRDSETTVKWFEVTSAPQQMGGNTSP